jgi:sialate O-acetylesterase
MSRRLSILAAVSLLLGWGGAALGDVTVASLFSDHAVLQRDIAIPVWGRADPGEEVTVRFGGQSGTTIAEDDGQWVVHLADMPASSEPREMIISGRDITTGQYTNTIVISDVQVGEVWLGGGQSNMQRPLSGDCDAAAAISDAAEHNLRFFNVTANGGNVASTAWEVSGAGSASNMSAVHFYFGRHLAKNMSDVPIGLITSAVSATAIERWATCAGSGRLYEGQIVPLQPYALRGVTWYQGEWDARGSQDSSKYYDQLPCLIGEWRADWGQGAFPFYVVQMPKMGIGSIHIVRDAELQTTLADPQVEMIVTIDQPGSDVHPPCKEPFGIRLADLARKFEYGHPVAARSPLYNADACYVDGNKIGVVFDNVVEGLESSGGELAEWEIAGPNGSYVAAFAKIIEMPDEINDTVEVWSDFVSNPVSARYAFRTNPTENNLINSAGLPASPIREVTPNPGYCGDGSCDSAEDRCNCPTDCDVPPSNETYCSDEIDNDCDLAVDCLDSDCEYDPVCILPPTDCSQYTQKRSCNSVAACRWDNRHKVCIAN